MMAGFYMIHPKCVVVLHTENCSVLSFRDKSGALSADIHMTAAQVDAMAAAFNAPIETPEPEQPL